jgi:hypothetical protein
VSRNAYSRVKCFFCEKGISSNGSVQTNHKRMHVREGVIVELRYTGKDYRPNSFIRPDHADSMLKTGYFRRVERYRQELWIGFSGHAAAFFSSLPSTSSPSLNSAPALTNVSR